MGWGDDPPGTARRASGVPALRELIDLHGGFAHMTRTRRESLRIARQMGQQTAVVLGSLAREARRRTSEQMGTLTVTHVSHDGDSSLESGVSAEKR